MGQTNIMNDRKKFNYNLMILMVLLLNFLIHIYNQKLLISNNNYLSELTQKMDQYFGPINDVELPRWEENP